MPGIGDPCPRSEGAACFHRHMCGNECVELAYEREKPSVDAALHRRARAAEGLFHSKHKTVGELDRRTDSLRLLPDLWRARRYA